MILFSLGILFFAVPLWGEESLVPRLVSSFPLSGASGVSPSVGLWRLVFDIPMDTSSWTLWKAPDASGDVPPLKDPGKNPWIDEKTCEFALGLLKENTTYALQCNAPGYEGFRSSRGVPLEVTLLNFSTRGEEEKAESLPPSGRIGGIVFHPLYGTWKTEISGNPVEIYFSPEGTFRYLLAGEERRGTYQVLEGQIFISPEGEELYSMRLHWRGDNSVILEDSEARLVLERSVSPERKEKMEEKIPIPKTGEKNLYFPEGFDLYRCYDVEGFRDALGKPLEVFSMLLPRGWKAEGGVSWKIRGKPVSLIDRNDLMQPVELRFRTFAPDGRAGIRFFPEVWFADLTRAPAAEFFPPGAPYGGVTSMPVMDPVSYLREYVTPFQAGLSGASLVDARELPDLAQRFDAEMAIFNRIGGMAGVRTDHRVGMVTLEYPGKGEKIRESMVAVLRYLSLPGMVLWWSCSSFSAYAPAEEFNAWQPYIATSLNSFQPNLTWLVKLMALLDRNLQGIADVDARVRQIDAEITRNRAETNAKIHRQMYPLLAPFADFVGPDGKSRFLPTDRDHQVDPDGNIRSGTDLKEDPGWEKLVPREHQ